jgi:DnaJ-class molecular chaperone
MSDPYETLGVRRGDSEDTIRKAYRKLAKRHHPDLNPDKPDAMERFKAINAANQLLSDPEQRARFDRGEIDGEGVEKRTERPANRQREAYANAAQGFGGQGFGGQGFAAEDFDDIFGGAFGAGRRGPAKGADAHYSLTVNFLDAANGIVRRLTLPDGRTLDVTIPAGLQDGHSIRLKAQGNPGRGGGPAGDAIVEISVAAHRYFRREGNDVLLTLPVTLKEAVLGASVEVPTVKGRLRLTVPPHSATGTKLRLSGRGIAGGHQIVDLKVMLPPQPEPALDAFLKDWEPKVPFDPRVALEDPL